MALKQVISFLESNKWALKKEGKKYLFFAPPKNLGFPSDYELPIPHLQDAPDYNNSLSKVENLLSDIYERNVSVFSDTVESYLGILKSNAIYFKLSSENKIFDKTLEINDIWQFLKNLSSSYTSFLSVDFGHKFSTKLSADSHIINNALRKIIPLTKLRVVDLCYKSFSIGVSTDSFMGKEKVESREINDWRSNILHEYKENVLDIDFNSKSDVDKILNKFNDIERTKIFNPLISSINNSSDVSIFITNETFTPRHKINRISKATVDLIVPKSIKKELETPDIGLYRTLLPIDESKPVVRLSKKELEEDMFTQKVDKYENSFSNIIINSQLINLLEPINYIIEYEKKIGRFLLTFPEINQSYEKEDVKNLEDFITKIFEKIINHMTVSLKPEIIEGHIIYDFIKRKFPSEVYS